MVIAENMVQNIKSLPETAQKEVADFLEFMLNKTKTELIQRENRDWSSFSMASALKGMEEDTFPEYTDSDFIEKWR